MHIIYFHNWTSEYFHKIIRDFTKLIMSKVVFVKKFVFDAIHTNSLTNIQLKNPHSHQISTLYNTIHIYQSYFNHRKFIGLYPELWLFSPSVWNSFNETKQRHRRSKNSNYLVNFFSTFCFKYQTFGCINITSYSMHAWQRQLFHDVRKSKFRSTRTSYDN